MYKRYFYLIITKTDKVKNCDIFSTRQPYIDEHKMKIHGEGS
jgi:hypothetical protein